MQYKLTDTKIKQVKSKDKDYPLTDGGGLRLIVRSNGSKVFVFNYNRPYTKKKNNITLGAYPEISLKQARERHAQARALLAQNIDPVQHREQDNAFKDAFQGAMNEKLGKWLIVQQAHQPSFKLCANVT